MSTFHNAMWAEASRDHAAESAERAVALSSVALAGLVPFLHAASSVEEYEQRLALVQPRAAELLAAHTPDTLAHEAALAQVRADFEALHQTRVAARLTAALEKQAEAGKGAGGFDLVPSESRPGEHDLLCPKCGSNKVILTMAPGYDGRIGSPGEANITRCNDCGHQSYEPVNREYRASKTAKGQVKCGGCGHEFSDGQRQYDRGGNELRCPECNSSDISSAYSSRWSKESAQHSDGSGKFKVQVTGVGEYTWSENSLSFDTEEEAKAYADDLMGRWMGADMARVVPVSTPRGASVEADDPAVVVNYRTGSRKQAAEESEGEKSDDKGGEECWDCGGTGTVPDMGEGDNGQEKCSTCGGSGRLSKTGARVAVVPPFGGEVVTASLDGITDDEIIEAEALLAEGIGPWGKKEPAETAQDRWERHHDDPKQHAKDEAMTRRYEDSLQRRDQRAASLTRVATVKCAKCTTAGSDCGYCDGAGALDATMAMIKAADGWDQGITAQSFLVAASTDEATLKAIRDRDPDGKDTEPTEADTAAFEKWVKSKYGEQAWSDYHTNWDTSFHEAVNSDAKGTDRYQKTNHPSQPGWVEDEWDEGKASQKELDEGRAGKDRGLPAGMKSTKQSSLIRQADLAALTRRLERLNGTGVDLRFTSDFGVGQVKGTLRFGDGNATVVTLAGAVHSIPVHNVLAVEATGTSGVDPGAGSAPDREPGILDWLGVGIGNGLVPSGATASRQVLANPYNSNPYDVEGPGSPNAGNVTAPSSAPAGPAVTPAPADPKTTRPRVSPEPAAYNPEAYPSSPEENKHRVGPVDRSADTIVVEDQTVASRIKAAEAAKAAFTAPPALSAREAKVGQITASVLTSNPGMGVDAARAVAEATVSRYAGVAGS